jgi:hypothetical protein
MKKIIVGFIVICLSIAATSQDDKLITFYERSGFKATPTYEETVAYCKLLDSASSFIHYTSFGKTPRGKDLPMLVMDADGISDADQAQKAGKLIFLIQAGIHPGEIDGKDAGLMFVRDLAVNRLNGGIPTNITFLFIPIFNVDGHERFGPYNRINQVGPEEMGWRTTAQNLNLNRDFLKADTPEMQAWLELYQQWQPDFFVDIHVTDGADYQYVMTYGLEIYGNMDNKLTIWAADQFTPAMESYMDQAGYPAFPYIMFRKWHDPRSGLRSSVGGPKFSQGYAAAQNRIGLLVENHSLKDYKTRVSATYELLRFLGEYLSEHAHDLLAMNKAADLYAASAEFRKEPFAVDYSAGQDSIMVDFRGVEYDVEKSDLTGGYWFKYHPDKPATFKVPYFNQQVPSATVILPEAYIIPPEWSEIVKKLPLHGIRYFTIDKPMKIKVETSRFTKIEYGKSSYEGRLQVKPTYETILETKEFPAGSVIVPTNQKTARVIAHMFEPASPDSYLQWGFFNATFEMKEYFETYQMEEYARKMIADKPELKEEFEQWKAANPEPAKDQWQQLEWFYFRSPYADKKKNVYPIGKIMEKTVVEKLINKK